MVYLLGFTI